MTVLCQLRFLPLPNGDLTVRFNFLYVVAVIVEFKAVCCIACVAGAKELKEKG